MKVDRHRIECSLLLALCVFPWLAARSQTVQAWGVGTQGQTAVPAGLTEIALVSAGSGFSTALRVDGSVTAWGKNDTGQSTVPPDLSGVASLSSGRSHTNSMPGISAGTVPARALTGQITLAVQPPSDLSFRIEISNDVTANEWTLLAQKPVGGNWSGPVSVSESQGKTVLTVTDPQPVSVHPRRFLRMVIAGP